MSSVYAINKGVNRSIEFKGLKAQWIWMLGIGLASLLILFAALYITGVNMYACIAVVGILGWVLFVGVYKLSRKYGEHGLMKKMARGAVPKAIKGCSFKSLHNEITH